MMIKKAGENMAEMLEKEIPVYSEKYDVHGVIRDYGMVTKLFFTYKDREIVMGIRRNVLYDKAYEELGKNIIESYVDKLATPEKGRKLQLHYWYIDEEDGAIYSVGHGIVTGHKRLADSTDIHTSDVQSFYVDEEAEELVLNTMNSVYHCPLEYCLFRKQDKFPNIIPNYEAIKAKYDGSRKYPEIEQGKVLLVLSNFSDYYFHSLYYVPKDSVDGKRLDFSGYPHIGTYQDSFLINTEDYRIDLRYFPHYQNVEFYSADTDGCPWFIENIGDSVLYARTNAGMIKLNPGDRKEVKKDNAESETPVLPNGDLYPAGVIE